MSISFKIGKYLYFALLFFAVSLALRELAVPYVDFDLWLHLFAGKDIISQRAIPLTDTYSFTANGLQVINHEWLSQIFMAAVYSFSGDRGLFVWKFIAFAIILFLTWKHLERYDGKLTKVTALILCILALRSGISFRPQIFSYLFLALIIYLEEVQFGKTSRELKLKSLLYPSMFLLWANMHGAFTLGLCVYGLYAIFSRELVLKNLLILLVSVTFTLLNPYSLGLYFYIFHELTLGISSEYITEWQPFSFAARESAFLIIFIVAAVGMLLRYRSIKYTHLILLAVAAWLGFGAVRNTPLIALMGLPALGAALNFLLGERKVKEEDPRVYNIISVPVVLLSFFMLLTTDYSFKLSTADDNYPLESISWMKEHKVKGNLAVPLHWGGYALFNLYPDVRVSIDGRWATLYPEDLMRLAHELSYRSQNAHWEAILDDLNADYFLAEKDNPAINEVRESSKWTILFEESGAILAGRLK